MVAAKDKLFGDRVVAVNRRARFEYELGDKYEAGLQLIGSEVRALRVHGADLSDAWVDITRTKQAIVRGMRIPSLTHAAFAHAEARPRNLLLHTAEIERLGSMIERERMTVVALSCYFKNGRAKLEIALARGKKQYDKRQSLKERDAKRETHAAIREGKRGGAAR
jgi:SsrA-binding protein